MTTTFVLGLDGASWKLLEPWIENDSLPNIAALRETGSWAESSSCLPPVTFPNWKCYASGKNPGEFGVFWFEDVDLTAGEITPCNGDDFDTPELWDYLNDEGLSAGVINMPSTYPPREVDQLLISGGPDAVEGEYRSIEDGYTHPPELAAELESRFGYRVHPEPLLSSNEETGAEVEAILDLFETRFETATTLLDERDLDFVHLTLFYLNVLHHFFWDDMPAKRGWQIVDEWVGRLDDRDDLNLILMSDHGADATQTEFYINEWLAQNSYQTRKWTIDRYFQRVGLTRNTTLEIAKKLGVVNLLERAVPERIQQLVPQEAGVKRSRKLESVDLSDTQAVASGQGPIYLTPDCDESTRERLMTDLAAIEDAHGRIFLDVHKGEELYSGRYADKAPEIVVEQRPGVHVNDGIGGGEALTEPDRWEAENTNTGIFIANGPDFAADGNRERISILDIAPTVLAACGCDVPTDMQGEVLDLFVSDPEVGERDPLGSRVEQSKTDDEVADRLRKLGYME